MAYNDYRIATNVFINVLGNSNSQSRRSKSDSEFSVIKDSATIYGANPFVDRV